MDTLEEDRLEAALDEARTVVYEGESYTYEPDYHWGTGDFQDEYPVIVLNYQTEAAQRDGDQPMNDLIAIDEREGEVDYDFHKGARVSDELQLTVAAESGFDANGVPAHVLVQQMAKAVWKQIRFTLDLNSIGDNGESPMVFNIGGSPSGPYRQDDTVRANFVFEANYVEIVVETVESVADAETDATIN